MLDAAVTASHTSVYARRTPLVAAVLFFVLALAAGCSSSTAVTTVRTPLAAPLRDYKVLVVDVTSKVPRTEQNAVHLEGALLEQLRQLNMFQRVLSRRSVETIPADARLEATITSFRGVSANARAWGGAFAGTSSVSVDVVVTAARTGGVLVAATVEGTGSEGPFGGTSAEAIQRASEEIARLVATGR